jgi:hypothetical protein
LVQNDKLDQLAIRGERRFPALKQGYPKDLQLVTERAWKNHFEIEALSLKGNIKSKHFMKQSKMHSIDLKG